MKTFVGILSVMVAISIWKAYPNIIIRKGGKPVPKTDFAKEPKKDYKAALDVLKGKIDEALKGGNVGPDIKKAVWEMLTELGIAVPPPDKQAG